MKRPDTGTIYAADGWRLRWDLSGKTLFDDGRVMPDGIWIHGPERPSNNISGTISHRDLALEIRRFRRKHGPQQMRMAL